MHKSYISMRPSTVLLYVTLKSSDNGTALPCRHYSLTKPASGRWSLQKQIKNWFWGKGVGKGWERGLWTNPTTQAITHAHIIQINTELTGLFIHLIDAPFTVALWMWGHVHLCMQNTRKKKAQKKKIRVPQECVCRGGGDQWSIHIQVRK